MILRDILNNFFCENAPLNAFSAPKNILLKIVTGGIFATKYDSFFNVWEFCNSAASTVYALTVNFPDKFPKNAPFCFLHGAGINHSEQTNSFFCVKQ
jgi:hypothetical protein